MWFHRGTNGFVLSTTIDLISYVIFGFKPNIDAILVAKEPLDLIWRVEWHKHRCAEAAAIAAHTAALLTTTMTAE